MARNKGTFNASFNFQVKMQEAFDPRTAVSTKADLINKETWPYDGDTIYLYNGIVVSVADEKSLYMLTDITNVLSSDYSGWLRVDAGNAEQVDVIDNLESDRTDAALSAKQGKQLMNEINTVAGKLTNIYTYKGSKATYAKLPTDAIAGDVWNVEEAHGGHPAGTNWAWTGTEWDALGGNIDLSVYYTKTEVDAAILVEENRAKGEESRLEGLINANAQGVTEAKNAANDNKTALESVTKNIGDINTVLNGLDEDDTDGLVGRLASVESKNTAQDTRLTNLEKLVSGGEGGEGGTTILEMVNQNAADIEALEKRVEANENAIEILNGTGEGSVKKSIEDALDWIDVE